MNKFDELDPYPIVSMPLIVIMMGTFNGALFLSEQLDSIENQTYTNWRLIVSDDGSTDATLDILKSYQARWLCGKLEIRLGQQKGFCWNFLSLACDKEIQADYYAFSDQDDVWLETKLAHSINNIQTNESSQLGYLYCGRTKYVDINLKSCGMSPLFVLPKTFSNAIIQSIAGGNTMVFNQRAKELLESAGIVMVASHDWWLYILVTGSGGRVFYDTQSQVFYRQHPSALVGGNHSLTARVNRVKMLLLGRFRNWNTQNIAALNENKSLLSDSSLKILNSFKEIRDQHIFKRLGLIFSSTIYRQTKLGNINLILATLVKKI